MSAPTPSARQLTDADVEAIADAVAARLASLPSTPPPELVDAAEVARRFGISKDTVYTRASEWGAVRIGDGPRPRLRFDPEVVAAALTGCSPSRGTEPPKPAPRAKPRRRARGSGAEPERLLPITPPGGAE